MRNIVLVRVTRSHIQSVKYQEIMAIILYIFVIVICERDIHIMYIFMY